MNLGKERVSQTRNTGIIKEIPREFRIGKRLNERLRIIYIGSNILYLSVKRIASIKTMVQQVA